jgi:hypothetical protein
VVSDRRRGARLLARAGDYASREAVRAIDLRSRQAHGDGRSVQHRDLHLDRLDGRDLATGEMAFVLMNVGCRLRDEEPNAFAFYLRYRLANHAQFCDDAVLPQRLLEYSENYCNRAMHVHDLTAGDCKAARDYLIEEPTRPLLYLTEALRPV